MSLSKQYLIKQIVNAQTAFWLALAKASLVIPNKLIAITTHLNNPYLNLVVNAEFAVNTIVDDIQTAMNFFNAYSVPWTWCINPLSTPKTLHRYLEQYGLTFMGDATSMGLDLTTFSPESFYQAVSIHEVIQLTDFQEWIKPINEGFPSSDTNGEKFLLLNANLNYGPNTSFRHYYLRERQQTVAAATLFLWQDTAMLHNIATCSAFRGRGFASVLCMHALAEAKKLGIRYCFLDSSKDGLRLYQRLGFKQYFTSQIYGVNVSDYHHSAKIHLQ